MNSTDDERNQIREPDEAAAEPEQKWRVAVFDDDAFILGLTERVLQLAGYRVRTATDLAGAGLTVAEFEPHLVLMDVDFGGRNDGLDAVSRLRQLATRQTSWVLHSASPPDRLKVWAAECGADNWLYKDGDIAGFLARVAGILEGQATP